MAGKGAGRGPAARGEGHVGGLAGRCSLQCARAAVEAFVGQCWPRGAAVEAAALGCAGSGDCLTEPGTGPLVETPRAAGGGACVDNLVDEAAEAVVE